MDGTVDLSSISDEIDLHMGVSCLAMPRIEESNNDNKELFENYVLDQNFMWVIRSYLINAKLHGYITDDIFNSYLKSIETTLGRQQLAVSIIMAAVPVTIEMSKPVDGNGDVNVMGKIH